MTINTSPTNTEQLIEPQIALAVKQIEAFADKYGKDHLDLAMHLAFPLAITPDLAYQIRHKFCQNIPWVAVSDCLLSYLWHEVDDDLYEVDVTVRQVLLHELQRSELGEERLRDLARFLLGQLQKYSQEVRRLYEWIGNSYVAKEKAVKSIVKTINSLLWNESLELIRIGTIINSLAVPLRADEYSPVLTVSHVMLQYAYGNIKGAIADIDYNFSNLSSLEIAGVNLLIPRFFQFETVTVNRKGEEIILPREPKSARYFREVLPGNVYLDMVQIPGGKFIMGSQATEKGHREDEGPQHEVTVKSFFMGKYPITQLQYEAIMGENPSYFKGSKRPVDSVNWYQAVEFCEKLSKLTGRKYSLPSEAQWEYSARAGTTTPFYFGETITSGLANYNGKYTYAEEPKGKYKRETTNIGIFPPNAFGLYDLHGNVWEWCEDNWHNNYEGAPHDCSAWVSVEDEANENYSKRRLRGGSWGNNPNNCRVAYRFNNSCTNLYNNFGLRVSCEVM